jgi:S1-C subfamily serine protease
MPTPRIAATLAGLLIAVATIAAAQRPQRPLQPVAASPVAVAPVAAAPVTTAPVQLTPEELANIRVYEVANQSVVHVTTSVVQYHPILGVPIEGGEGSGSGAILDRQGHILTNHHVIDGASSIKVTFSNDHSYDAEVVGSDDEYDIAVLKISPDAAEKLVPIQLGRSDNLRVGQKAYALGNPFGLDGTLTTGILSSLNRSLPSRVDSRVMDGMIQTDAAMNPGNSGGPLLNTNAEMIGMCVAIASRTGQNSGVGFAIPIDRIRAVLPDLIAHGKVVRADIGISEVMETSSGLVLGRLTPGGPADQAGLKGFEVLVRRDRGFVETSIDRSHADRIVAADGEPMTTGVQFQDKIWEHRPGDVIKLTIIRDGKEMEVSVTLTGA